MKNIPRIFIAGGLPQHLKTSIGITWNSVEMIKHTKHKRANIKSVFEKDHYILNQSESNE